MSGMMQLMQDEGAVCHSRKTGSHKATLQNPNPEDLNGDMSKLSSTRFLHLFRVIQCSDEWRLNADSTSSAYYFQQTLSSRGNGSGEGLHGRELVDIFQNFPVSPVSCAFLIF